MHLTDKWKVTIRPGRFGWWATGLRRGPEKLTINGLAPWDAWAPTKVGALRRAQRAARRIEARERRTMRAAQHTIDLELDPEPKEAGPA